MSEPPPEAPANEPPKTGSGAELFLRRVLGAARATWEFATRHKIVPTGAVPPALRNQLPRGILHWLSVGLLAIVFSVYLAFWISGNFPFLTDPMLQTDDARTVHFPFHRYGPDKAMANDPLASDMLGFSPPGIRLLYRLLVPVCGLFVATKIVQLICLLLIFLAAWWIIRSKKGGLAAGLLMAFMLLHSWWVVNRIAGGTPRAFAFPLLALWVAGALSDSERRRYVAAMLCSITYPTAMVIILGAEGLLLLHGVAIRGGLRLLFGRLKRYALLVGGCFLLILPFALGNERRGDFHTLEEARRKPVFGHRGRVRELPWPDPVIRLGHHVAQPFQSKGRVLAKSWYQAYRRHGNTGPLLFLGAMLLLLLLRASPSPYPVIALLVAVLIVYWLARLFAFRLYTPTRYLTYGGTAVGIALTVSTVGFIGTGLTKRLRAGLSNVTVALFIGLLCLLAGDGVIPKNGLTIDGRRHAPLYAFARTLPPTSRIAAHPGDADDLPFWAARATTGGHETLSPWFKNFWRRRVKVLNDTITALYATRRQVVRDYVRKYGITHFLLRRDRYGPRFRRLANFFEPIGRHARRLVRWVHRQDLILGDVDPRAVVFRYRALLIVDVKRLLECWR